MAQKQLTIRMDAKLYKMAKDKCNKEFGITLSPLVKIFLKSFVTQHGVGFFVGDEDLRKIILKWLSNKQFDKARGGKPIWWGPRIKDIYNF